MGVITDAVQIKTDFLCGFSKVIISVRVSLLLA